MTSTELNQDAIALLTMIVGNIAATTEIAEIMSTYGYIEDADDPLRWDLNSTEPGDDGAAICFGPNYETVEIISNSIDNITNANYILTKIGWSECKALVSDSNTQKIIFSRLTNISVASCDIDGVAPSEQNLIEESRSLAAKAEIPTVSGNANEEVIRDIQNNHRDINTLQEKLAASERDNADLLAKHEAAELIIEDQNREIAILKSKPAVISAGSDSHGYEILCTAVANFIGKSFDVGSHPQGELITALRQCGYDFQVTLVKVK